MKIDKFKKFKKNENNSFNIIKLSNDKLLDDYTECVQDRHYNPSSDPYYKGEFTLDELYSEILRRMSRDENEDDW